MVVIEPHALMGIVSSDPWNEKREVSYKYRHSIPFLICFRVRSRLETLQANKTVVASIAKINQEMEKTMQCKSLSLVNFLSSRSFVSFLFHFL
jgi:hypothetical protein